MLSAAFESVTLDSNSNAVFSWASGAGPPAPTLNCSPNTRLSNCACGPEARSAWPGLPSHSSNCQTSRPASTSLRASASELAR